MKVITHEMIKQLNISPKEWLYWVNDVLKNKDKFIMPAKTSLHYEDSYFNTMPSILPCENIMGTKVVNRYLNRTPSLDSQLLLYKYDTGENIALMDANMITAMRTGAVTVHAIDLLAKDDFYEIGIMGFGNIGIATLEVLTDYYSERKLKVKLLRYKDHTDKIIKRFSNVNNIEFVVVDSIKDIVCESDIVISCITYTDKLLAEDSWFKEGVLVIPVHLRGFQNCDLFFDKVYGDDYGQVRGFKYFEKFRYFAETSEVVRGVKRGRTNNNERILSYNVGMSLHDVYAAKKIYDKAISCQDALELDLSPKERYWL